MRVTTFPPVAAMVLAVAGSARGQQTVGLADLIVDGADVEVPSGIRAIIGPGVTVIPGEPPTPPKTPGQRHRTEATVPAGGVRA